MSHGYFSRMTLLPSARREPWYRQAVSRGPLYRDHAAVWRAFPEDGAQRDFLFRAGEAGPDGRRPYYVVSLRQPVPVRDELLVETKQYAPRFNVGEVLRFSLRANPTVSRGKGGARSKRHDVLMDAKRDPKGLAAEEAMNRAAEEWLMNRGPRMGLAIEASHLRMDGYCQHVAARAGGPPLRFSSLDFDGSATVSDPARLIDALIHGVGHSKGFGCGLLMVRRL